MNKGVLLKKCVLLLPVVIAGVGTVLAYLQSLSSVYCGLMVFFFQAIA